MAVLGSTEYPLCLQGSFLLEEVYADPHDRSYDIASILLLDADGKMGWEDDGSGKRMGRED